MAAITKQFGTGGSGLTPGGTNEPTLATALREIADDLASLKGFGAAAIASPDASDLPTAITLVNEIKGALNAARTTRTGATLKTTKA